MKYALVVMIVASTAVALLTLTAKDGESAFHLNRIWGVMGGAGGDASIQYVEIRMATGGQNLLDGHDICFFDDNGDPWARFTFDDGVSNGASGSSILIGSEMMDVKWTAGEPDFTFNADNTIAIAGGADLNAPVHPGSGKVAFGSDPAEPAELCAGSFDVIDSVAYGSTYTGDTDFPPAFASDLPVNGTQAMLLQAALCMPGCQVNSTDYAVVDVNAAGNNPRNNGNDSGPLDLSATPTPTPSPTGTPEPTESPSPSPSGTAVPGVELTFGDLDCGGAVNAVDALKSLQFVAAIPFGQEPQCPEVGAEIHIAAPASGDHIIWADVNCDGAVNAVDALQDLRHVAALGVTQEPGCPAIGSILQIAP